MKNQTAKACVVVLGLSILAGCVGSSTDSATLVLDEGGQVDELLAFNDEDAVDPESIEVTETTTSGQVATTTEVPAVTTTEPVSLLSPEDAVQMYDAFIEQLEQYSVALYIDRDATVGHARAITELLDPALLAGPVDEVTDEWHSCNADEAVASSVFELTGIEIEIEHVRQHVVNPESMVLEVEQIFRFEGFPETSQDDLVLVTVDGVGPTVKVEADEGACATPQSAAAEALIAEALEVLPSTDAADVSDEVQPAD